MTWGGRFFINCHLSSHYDLCYVPLLFWICGSFVPEWVLCCECIVLDLSSDNCTRILLLVPDTEPLLSVFVLLPLRVITGVRITDDCSVFSCGGRGRRLRSQACRIAALGVNLTSGSHSKQRFKKSRNSGSSQPFNALFNSFEPGGPRGLPLLDRPPVKTIVPSGSVDALQYLGYPFELMKFFERFPRSISFCGGIPRSSIMHASWSPSSSPGSNGKPVRSSASMQPNDHISIGIP